MKCAGCQTTEVGNADYCFGCDRIICWRCITRLGHQHAGAPHALTNADFEQWENRMAQRAKKETVEDVIRMATRVQTRLRKEGIALAWTMHYQPCEPEPKKRRARSARG